MKEKNICKYCGTTYTVQSKSNTKHPDTCGNCILKLPLARKFVEVCDDIKRKVYKEGKR